MEYIEENIRKRRGEQQPGAQEERPYDPQEELYRIDPKYKGSGKEIVEGTVAGSLAMLTAIPEVDLGMECVRSLAAWSRLTSPLAARG